MRRAWMDHGFGFGSEDMQGKQSPCRKIENKLRRSGEGFDHLVLGIDRWRKTASCGQEKERRQLLETLSPAALSVMF